MAEKRGQTVKLIYDFPTQLSTEIGYEDGFWARVTCNRFRSYNGLRRILYLNEEGKGEYKDYNGPVYYFDSNIVLKDYLHHFNTLIHFKLKLINYNE